MLYLLAIEHLRLYVYFARNSSTYSCCFMHFTIVGLNDHKYVLNCFAPGSPRSQLGFLIIFQPLWFSLHLV